jgi:hypothetical protein
VERRFGESFHSKKRNIRLIVGGNEENVLMYFSIVVTNNKDK